MPSIYSKKPWLKNVRNKKFFKELVFSRLDAKTRGIRNPTLLEFIIKKISSFDTMNSIPSWGNLEILNKYLPLPNIWNWQWKPWKGRKWKLNKYSPPHMRLVVETLERGKINYHKLNGYFEPNCWKIFQRLDTLTRFEVKKGGNDGLKTLKFH